MQYFYIRQSRYLVQLLLNCAWIIQWIFSTIPKKQTNSLWEYRSKTEFSTMSPIYCLYFQLWEFGVESKNTFYLIFFLLLISILLQTVWLILLWFFIGSWGHFPCFWLAVMLTLVLVLHHSLEKRFVQSPILPNNNFNRSHPWRDISFGDLTIDKKWKDKNKPDHLTTVDYKL